LRDALDGDGVFERPLERASAFGGIHATS
jgi:hypothetical protein